MTFREQVLSNENNRDVRMVGMFSEDVGKGVIFRGFVQ